MSNVHAHVLLLFLNSLDYYSHKPLRTFEFSEMLRFLFTLVHRWKLNDSFIHPRPGSRYSLVGGNLHISRLNKDEDVGIYQCLGSNSFGTIVSREASLHVACECCRRVSAVSTFCTSYVSGRQDRTGGCESISPPTCPPLRHLRPTLSRVTCAG